LARVGQESVEGGNDIKSKGGMTRGDARAKSAQLEAGLEGVEDGVTAFNSSKELNTFCH
jgi:hypothetical protein